MTNMPRPGDFGLSRIGGFVGWWIGMGQLITGDASRYTHAFIVLDDETVIEAMPGGAVITPLSEYRGKAVFSNLSLTDEQRATVVREGRALKGVPYSFLDYLALALAHFGFKPKRLRKYITNKGHMICSQLVDEVYRRAGIHMFNDGRLPQDVTPGDLANYLIERDWELETL
ncbi:enoyl-CoA hydratase/carnithine racemase-like [Streptomyces phage Wakanda]|uniref:Peptidase n=1 Tax=Streptomyces phage Wakanda TaxID=2713267 RepID=A0A6G8R1M5_9CAUD|nr:enoyl-CoA hydratase/carnithine racemase-like [Streptomyces phage Wakanda]QIN94086.1 peptidase [Streptomyces phage Wakanda]